MRKYICVIAVLIHFLAWNVLSKTIYVKTDGTGNGTSWENAYSGDSLQTAINIAEAGDNVWVAKGTYKPNSWPNYQPNTERYMSFVHKANVTLCGGFFGNELSLDQRDLINNETILSGDIGVEGDSSDNCYHVLYYNPAWQYYYYPIIFDGITIADGMGYSYGAGIYINGGYLKMRNCIIKNNFSVTYGGGIYCSSNPGVRAEITNCIFYKNKAEQGGAIYAREADIINCTIVNNHANTGGGIYLLYASPYKLYNNILWNNSDQLVIQYDAIQNNVAFNAIEGGYPGMGNIDLDSSNDLSELSPHFVDPYNFDFRITENSPCIDSGVYWNAPIIDIDLKPRPSRLCYDIGAYEFQSELPNGASPTITTISSLPTISTALCKGSITDIGSLNLIRRGIKFNTEMFDPATEGQLIYEFGNFNNGDYEIRISGLEKNTTYYYCSFTDNQFGDSFGEILTFNTLSGLEPDVNSRIYVKADGSGTGSSWSNALNSYDIQYAIDNEDVTELWIAAGIYYPSSYPAFDNDYDLFTEREKHFHMRHNKKIYGGFNGTEINLKDRDFKENQTIFSGDIGVPNDNSDNCYHVFYHKSDFKIDSTSIIDGIIISDGNSNGLSDHQYGGGMFNKYSSPTISNCIFRNNSAVYGGALFNGYYYSKSEVIHSSPVIRNSEFCLNTASVNGGAIYDESAFPKLINSVVCNNSATENGGGIFHTNGSYGGSITDTLKISHCTFANNNSVNGESLYLNNFNIWQEQKAKITNSIFFGSNSQINSNEDFIDIIIEFCAVTGGFAGLGNYNLSINNQGYENSPNFSDPSNSDFSLQSNSPCINRGMYWYKTNNDFLGVSRPQGAGYDMGAYEFPSGGLTGTAPNILTSFADGITSSSAKCHISVLDNGGTFICEYGIKVSEFSGFEPENEGILYSIKEEPSLSQLEIPVGGLEPVKQYFYRAYAINCMGYSYGLEESFSTTGLAPDANGIFYVTENGTGTGNSWANALNKNDLQAAIDHTSTKQVWVAKGIYKPQGWPANDELNKNCIISKAMDNSYEKHFSLKKGVELFGGFNGTETDLSQRDYEINKTILSGDIGIENDSTDNCYHVFINIDLDSTTVIDGFIIKDGFDRSNEWIYGGGGMLNFFGPKIRNCSFLNNYSKSRGGAIYFANYSYEYPDDTFYKIENCIFENNSGSMGGAIQIDDYTPLNIYSCIFSGNNGGAIYARNESIEVVNSIFYRNKSEYQGSAFNSYLSKAVLINNTFAQNISENGYESIILNGNDFVMRNNVIWGNGKAINLSNDYGYAQPPVLPKIEYCAVQGEISGYYIPESIITLSSNNLGDPFSPYFTDPDNNDWSLQANSPLIDFGCYWNAPDNDIIGAFRPQGKAYDIGAYEYPAGPPSTSPPIVETGVSNNITASTVACSSTLTNNGGLTTIRRGIKISDNNGFDPVTEGKLFVKTVNSDIPNFTNQILGLKDNVNYFYRAYAENSIGCSYGQQLSFKTNPILKDKNGIVYIKENGTGQGNSWDQALNSIDLQAAIYSDSTKQVWISKGTYKPNSWPMSDLWEKKYSVKLERERDKHFSMKRGVEIYGGFAGNETDLSQRNYIMNETVFSGDIGIPNDSTDNCYCVFLNISDKITEGSNSYFTIDSTAVIDGCVISDAFDDYSSVTGSSAMNNYCAPFLRNCKFKHNKALSLVYNYGDSPNDTAYLINCIFEYNNSRVVNLYSYRNYSFDQCIFRYNSGTCIYSDWWGSRNKLINNCIFHNNAGTSVMIEDRATITNSLFYDNDGQAVAYESFKSEYGVINPIYPIMYNNTIVNNRSDEAALDIYTNEGCTLINNVIWGNQKQFSFGKMAPDTEIHINNCAVEGGISGTYIGSSNINLSTNNTGSILSPLFVDPDNHDWRISKYSPLINAGILTEGVPLYDLSGFQRDLPPDIGCYEYGATSIDESDNVLPLTTELYQNYPNPFNPATNIKFALSKSGKVELSVFNITGQLVRKVLDKEMTAGNYNIKFEADDLNSGMYFYKLKANGKEFTKKMLMVK